jgi:DNA-directed RNA polymerase subunit RPC12/RpoP
MGKSDMSRSILKLQSETKTQPKNEHYSCSGCGNEYEKPIFAVNNSPGIAEGYYACPRCLSKMESPKDETIVENEVENTQSTEELENVQPKEIIAPHAVCSHYAGYLKKRSQNTPVPEECFTCVEMLDCMSH